MIGCAIAFDLVYDRICKKLEDQGNKVVRKYWRLEVPNQKEVYILVSYDQTTARSSEDKVTVGLFGFWKLYARLYEEMGWKVRLVCTFLEGNN